jgi:hypothetical protein
VILPSRHFQILIRVERPARPAELRQVLDTLLPGPKTRGAIRLMIARADSLNTQRPVSFPLSFGGFPCGSSSSSRVALARADFHKPNSFAAGGPPTPTAASGEGFSVLAPAPFPGHHPSFITAASSPSRTSARIEGLDIRCCDTR